MQKKILEAQKKMREKYEEERRQAKSNKKIIEKWIEISTKQQTEETIRNAVLEDQYSVCISFLCKYQKFSEDFLEELVWLTSKIFDKDNYNKDIVKLCIQFTDDFDPDERYEVLTRLHDFNVHTPVFPALTDKEKKYLIFTNYHVSKNDVLCDALIELFEDPDSYRRDRMDWGELNNWNLSKHFRDKYADDFEKAKMVVNYSDYMEDDSYCNNMRSPRLI